VGGGGDVVGVVVGAGGGVVGGGEVAGVVPCVLGVAGVDAAVGAVTFAPVLEFEVDPECCVVDVDGRVVVAPGAEVEVDAEAPAAVDAGIPLFNTANQTWPTFCPRSCPFFLSPSKR
jgi:hypothetical protein